MRLQPARTNVLIAAKAGAEGSRCHPGQGAPEPLLLGNAVAMDLKRGVEIDIPLGAVRFVANRIGVHLGAASHLGFGTFRGALQAAKLRLDLGSQTGQLILVHRVLPSPEEPCSSRLSASARRAEGGRNRTQLPEITTDSAIFR